MLLERGRHFLEGLENFLSVLSAGADAEVRLHDPDLQPRAGSDFFVDLGHPQRPVAGNDDEPGEKVDEGDTGRRAVLLPVAEDDEHGRVDRNHREAHRRRPPDLGALDPQGLPAPEHADVDRKDIGDQDFNGRPSQRRQPQHRASAAAADPRDDRGRSRPGQPLVEGEQQVDRPSGGRVEARKADQEFGEPVEADEDGADARSPAIEEGSLGALLVDCPQPRDPGDEAEPPEIEVRGREPLAAAA